ncbi:MAG TPA: hypothetical protein VL125_17485 [Pelobium sp.]|nr:hypothetical protein [Pelobium sp.]
MSKGKNTPPDKNSVYVNSRTYGGHWRAKRGSKTPASLNSNLQKSTADLEVANKAARLIKSYLDPFRYNFMGGLIWQKLVKEFKRQAKEEKAFHTENFNRMDTWDLYPMDRFRTYINCHCQADSLQLTVTLNLNRHPDFKRKFVDSYRISMLAIFPDFEKMEAWDEGCISDIFFLKDAVAPVSFHFPVPEGAKHYLLVLKIEGAEKGKLGDNYTIKSMQLIGGGGIV